MIDRTTLITQYMEVNQALIRLWKTRYFEAADAEGLSPALMGTLTLLEREQPITSTAIAKHMHITRGAVTQLIDALTDLGYICRETDPDDRRMHYLRLSDKGEEIVERLTQVRRKIFEDVTCNLSNEELRQVIAIDQKIIHTLE